MLKKIILTGLLVFGAWTGSVFATGDTVSNIPIKKLDELAATPTDDTDFIPAYDASQDKDVKIDVDRFSFKAPSDTAITSSGNNAFTGDNTHTGSESFDEFDYGTDTVTTDSADPGTVTATLAKAITYVISDATGSQQDVVTVPDGTLEGQIKKFIYLTDAETSGVVIAPTNVTMVGGAGTSTLLEDAGDSVEFTWNSALGWTLTGNIGGTIQ